MVLFKNVKFDGGFKIKTGLTGGGGTFTVSEESMVGGAMNLNSNTLTLTNDLYLESGGSLAASSGTITTAGLNRCRM